MNRQTFLPHTADVRLKIEADSLEELFAGALQGMGNLLREGSCRGGFTGKLSQELSVSSTDLAGLLIDFLSQALLLSQEQKAVFCRLAVDHLDDTSLRGRLQGRYVDGFDEDIKAVTYHQAQVRRQAGGTWETVVVFDI